MESATQQSAFEHRDWDGEGLEQATQPFIGRWNQLVSQTNWEKGHIIQQWRDALMDGGAPAADYSDDAWSRRVGGVTGQHVGRLRRVFQRFGQTRQQFSGLYWSHFQACLDWEDAEMWLEGALQNGWSVSQMRHQRWETMGAVAGQMPDDAEIIVSEVDEDLEHGVHEPPLGDRSRQAPDSPGGPRPEGPDFGDEQSVGDVRAAAASEHAAWVVDDASSSPVTCVRPFVHVGELPDDLAQAFESFKLAILNHKMEGWKQVARDDVLVSLDALKDLVTSPPSEDVPVTG